MSMRKIIVDTAGDPAKEWGWDPVTDDYDQLAYIAGQIGAWKRRFGGIVRGDIGEHILSLAADMHPADYANGWWDMDR